MDLTPHDLRNAELREAFRGYRPDEVEELLERAAITLERMHERNRMLQERLSSVETETSEGKEIETVLRQTLLLAQRTADETVTSAHERARLLLEEAEDRALALVSEAEAQARSLTSEAEAQARSLTSDAEAQARSVMSEAEAEARKLSETSRAKFQAIVSELSARRDLLVADIEALERVQGDYRSRLRSILEKELDDLNARPALAPLPRPDLHEIDLSAAEEAQEAEAEEAGPPTVPLATGQPAKAQDADDPFRPPAPEADLRLTGETDIREDSEGEAAEALVVVDEEPSGNGHSGLNRRLG